MKRLLIDASSILMSCLHAAVGAENAYPVQFEGKEKVIPSQVDGYEIFLGSLEKTLEFLSMVPSQIVLIKDGAESRVMRQKFLKGYKVRPSQAPEFYQEYNVMLEKVEETLWSYGAISVVKAGFEADDLIAAFAEKMDHVIWSKDGDLLAAGDWFYNGQMNPDKFYGIAKKYIVVYKSLVGDTSDKIPGAKGFGKGAFVKMLEKFGDDCLRELKEMLDEGALKELKDHAADFKPFQKILDNEAMVYASYKCAKFYHPGWDLDIQARFPATNGDLPAWNRTEKLITSRDLTPAFIAGFEQELLDNKVGHIGFDIETWQDEESLAWGLANKSKNDKFGKLDVYGSHMAGFSVTAGSNNQHVYYFPIEHTLTDNISLGQMTDLLNLIPDGMETLVHNNAFELPVVRNHIELRFDRGWLPNVVDTMIEKNYVDENTSKALKFCSKTYLNYRQVSYAEVTDGLQMNELTGLKVCSYGADDSVVTVAIHSVFRLIMDYEGTSKAFDMCERDSSYLFAEAFLNGLKFDLDRLKELKEANDKEYAELWAEIEVYLCTLDGYPGTRFIPAEKFSAPEVKRLFKLYSGEVFKTQVRKPKKLAKILREEFSSVRFADAVEDKDVEMMNQLAHEEFEPAPILNMRSPKQKSELLYDYLGYPIRLRGPLTDTMKKEGKDKGNPKANGDAFKLAVIGTKQIFKVAVLTGNFC